MVVGTKEPTTYHAQRMSDMHTYDGRCYFITILSNMHVKKNLNEAMSLTVTDGVTVNVLPNEAHEYLMTTKEVARGYDVTEYNIRVHKMQHSNELIEGKHYVTAVSIPNGELPSALKTAHNAVLWTKRGIVRLGFFIRSERARLFRDWAEELILSVSENLTVNKALPARRNHNRLTSDRLIRLLSLTNLIEDSELRKAISNELTGKEAQHGNL